MPKRLAVLRKKGKNIQTWSSSSWMCRKGFYGHWFPNYFVIRKNL